MPPDPVAVRRAYADNVWGQLHYRIARPAAGVPQATPLLCLHLTPKSGWIFEPLLADLGATRVALAPGTPGYGGSDAPPAPVSAEDYARAILAFLDRLVDEGTIGEGPVDLLGYHTGSTTAIELARIAPDRVRRLVLVSLADFTEQEQAARIASLDFADPLREDGSHVTAQWAAIGRVRDARLDHEWHHHSLAENLRAGRKLWWAYNAVHKYDLEAGLSAIAALTLVINPEDDLWDRTRIAAARHPRFGYVELPGTGHGAFHAEREAMAKLVSEFLDG